MTGKKKKLKTTINRYGYECVSLYYDGVKYTYKVHRLVALAFIPIEPGKDEVNHIDGNKLNNCVYNLEWSDRTDNMRHAVTNNLHKAISGENHPNCKYSDKQIKKVCELLKNNKLTLKENLKEISKKTKVDKRTIDRIIKGETHKNITKQYDFTSRNNIEIGHNKHRKYSDKQIQKVCKELVKNKLTMYEISDKTGVSYSMVKAIRLNKRYTNISKDYDFSNYNKIRLNK